MTDFNALDQYRAVITADPFRRGLHYPAAAQALGDVRHRRILDVGCGDSPFPAMLAEQGASVTGYDKAAAKINAARSHEETDGWGFAMSSPRRKRFPIPACSTPPHRSWCCPMPTRPKNSRRSSARRRSI
jgi:predicted RNA methylase